MLYNPNNEDDLYNLYYGGEDEEKEENEESINQNEEEESGDTKREETDEFEIPSEDNGEEEVKEDLEIPMDKTTEDNDNDADIVIPESFESVEEEKDFYKTHFENSKSKFKDFNADNIIEKYEDQLIEKENDFEELKALRNMLKGKPDHYVKMRFKDQLEKAGYNSSLTVDESKTMIHEELVKSFGSNYGQIYDIDEAAEEGTISYNMLKKQNEIKEKIKEINSQKTEQASAPVGDPEEAKKLINESLSKAGLKENSINKFIEDLSSQGQELVNNPIKMYKALYMDKIIEKERVKAFEEGRKEALADLKKVGSSPRKETNSDEPVTRINKEVSYI